MTILSTGGGNALFSFQSLGHTTGYEGVRASFSGLEWNYLQNAGTQDLSGTSFYFDADDSVRHAPNLVGEMTNAFVPERSVRPAWVFPDLWTGVEYIQNPYNRFTWDLPNPDASDEILAYQMEEWILRMYVSITAEFDELPMWEWLDDAEGSDERYQNTKIWIELDVSPIWYFEGASQVYFGLGKVVTSDVAHGKYGVTDDEWSPTSWMSVTPESGTSYRYLYYQNYGSGGQETEFDLRTYQGRTLNPEIFTDRMFIHVALNNFGTEVHKDPWTGQRTYKGDAITWGLDVHVFVVGEWKVQDVEQLPDSYGRDPKKVGETWSEFLARLFADPRAQFWFLLGLGALIFLLLAIGAPSVLILLFSLLGLGRTRKS